VVDTIASPDEQPESIFLQHRLENAVEDGVVPAIEKASHVGDRVRTGSNSQDVDAVIIGHGKSGSGRTDSRDNQQVPVAGSRSELTALMLLEAAEAGSDGPVVNVCSLSSDGPVVDICLRSYTVTLLANGWLGGVVVRASDLHCDVPYVNSALHPSGVGKSMYQLRFRRAPGGLLSLVLGGR